jgi:phosphopantothenoylcysteine synthetase/decarboxylase
LAVALARAAARRGHRVTAFLAEGVAAPRSRRIAVVRFTTSADLARELLRGGRRRPDAILHAAAVSDYAPRPVRGKLKSGAARLSLVLHPLPKVVTALRRRHPRALLVTWKLESRVSVAELKRRALAAARGAGAQAVFANRLEDVAAEHRGYLIGTVDGAATGAASRAVAARLLIAACERDEGGRDGASGAARSSR